MWTRKRVDIWFICNWGPVSLRLTGNLFKFLEALDSILRKACTSQCLPEQCWIRTSAGPAISQQQFTPNKATNSLAMKGTKENLYIHVYIHKLQDLFKNTRALLNVTNIIPYKSRVTTPTILTSASQWSSVETSPLIHHMWKLACKPASVASKTRKVLLSDEITWVFILLF